MKHFRYYNTIAALVILLALAQGASAHSKVDSDNVLNFSSDNGTTWQRILPFTMSKVCWNNLPASGYESCETYTQWYPNITLSVSFNGDAAISKYDEQIPFFNSASIYGVFRGNNSYTKVDAARRNASYFGGYKSYPDEPNTEAKMDSVISQYNLIKAADPNNLVSVTAFVYRVGSRNVSLAADYLVFDAYKTRLAKKSCTGLYLNYMASDDCTTIYYHRDDFIYADDREARTMLSQAGFQYKSIEQLVKPVTLYSVSQKEPLHDDTVRYWFQLTPKQQRAEMYWSLTAGYRGYGVWGNILNLVGSWVNNGTSHNQTQAIMINNLAGEYTDPYLQSYFTLPLSQQNKSWNYGDTWDNKVQFSSNPTKVTYGSTTSYTLSYRYYRNTTSSKDLLVVVNKGNSTLSDIGITISGLTGTRTATTLGSVGTGAGAPGRVKTVTNGQFTETLYAYDAILYEITAEQDVPILTSWGNNKTNDNSQSITINTSEVVMFNATANQSITTWNWNKDGAAQSVNLSSINLSWDATGTKSVSVTVTNDNGTSDATSWSVTVIPVSSNPSKIGIGGAGCSSPYCSTDHVAFDYGSGYARYGYVWDSFNDGDYGGTVMAGTFSVQNNALRQTTAGRIQYTLANYSNITLLLNVTDHINQTTDVMVMGDDSRADYNQAYIHAFRRNNLSRIVYKNNTGAWITVNDTDYIRVWNTSQYLVYSINNTGFIGAYLSTTSYENALTSGLKGNGTDTYYTFGRNIVLQSTNATYDDLWAHQWNRFDGNLTVSYDSGTGNEVPYFWLNLTGQHNATVRYRQTDTGSYTLIGTYTTGSNNISIPSTKYRNTQVQVQLNGNATSSIGFGSITFFAQVVSLPATTTGVYTIGASGAGFNSTFTINGTFDNTTIDLGSSGVRPAALADDCDGNTLNLTVYSGSWSMGGNRCIQSSASDTNSAAYYPQFNSTNVEVMAKLKISGESGLNQRLALAGRYSTSNDTFYLGGAVWKNNQSFIRRFVSGVSAYINYSTQPEPILGTEYQYKFSTEDTTLSSKFWQVGTSEPSYMSVVTDSNISYGFVGTFYRGTTFEMRDFVARNISGGSVVMDGNVTIWHNCGAGCEVYQLAINATTDTGNYSVEISQNGSGVWNLIGSGYTGSNTIELSSAYRYSNPDIRIMLRGTSTGTPLLQSVSFYTQGETAGGTNYVPPAPTNLSTFYSSNNIRYTWQAGTGNVTNSYNTSWQITGSANWVNGSSGTSGSCTLSGHQWCNVTVQAYNHSGSGSLNATMLTGNNRLPNAAISISNISDNYNITEGQTLTVDGDYSDADGDTGIFNSSANQGSFDINTGILTWTTGEGSQGEYYWSMNVSDGWGSVATKEYIVNVGNSTPANIDTGSITNTSYAGDTNGWLWILFGWTAPDNADRYYVFINGTAAGYVSVPEYYSSNFTAHTGNINFSVLPHNTTLGTNGSWANKTVSIPNNAPTIDTSTITATNPDTEEEEADTIRINETDFLNFTFSAYDIDADQITNSTNATNVFGGNFTESTATYSFQTNSSSSGTYYIDISSCDSFGLCTNSTITIIISDTATIAASSSGGGGGGGGSSSEEVTVTPNPTPTINATPEPDTFNLFNTPIKLPDKKTVRIAAIVGFSGAILILIASTLYNPRNRIVRKFKFNK